MHSGDGGVNFVFRGEVSDTEADGTLRERADGLMGNRRAMEPRPAHDAEFLIELHGNLRG